jgi:hypothetical protein
MSRMQSTRLVTAAVGMPDARVETRILIGLEPSQVVPSCLVASPQHDFLIGKGTPIQQDHPGNVKLRVLVDDCMDEYHAMEYGRKAVVVLKLFESVKADSSCRLFFRKGYYNGWWQEIPDVDAKGKITKLFVNSTGSKMNRIQQYGVAQAQNNEDDHVDERTRNSSIFQPEIRHHELLL